MRAYADRLYTGKFGIKDYDGAHYWFHRINDADAFFNLSIFYSTQGDENSGLNPYYDKAKSLDYLIKSGMFGDSSAMSLLSILYTKGYSALNLQTPIDKPIGAAWNIIEYMDQNGVIQFPGNNGISIHKLLEEYSAEDKARAMKLIDEYRDLHNIPKL